MELALKQLSRVAATRLRHWRVALPGFDRAFVSSRLRTTHYTLLEFTTCCRPSVLCATARVSSERWRRDPRTSPHVASLFIALPETAPLRPTYRIGVRTECQNDTHLGTLWLHYATLLCLGLSGGMRCIKDCSARFPRRCHPKSGYAISPLWV